MNNMAMVSQSPTKKKTTRKPNYSSSSIATRLSKRQDTVFKKAYELSTLCGIQVCVICYGQHGELKTWPKDIEIVKDMARRYNELSETKRRKGRVDLHEFLEKIETKDDSESKKKKKVKLGSTSKYPDWDPRFDYYSVEQLVEVIRSLECNLTRIQHRALSVAEAQKQRKIQNVADQEQRMMTVNQIQQQANPVSMNPFNYGYNTSTQNQASSSTFNQVQSLAPVPAQLMIHPWEQRTAFNDFQNGNNMYNSFNNMNVEDYLRCLGVQVTDGNGFQNVNMWGYLNNN